MVLDCSSLNLILLLFAHDVILLISKFMKFSATRTLLPLVTNIRSSANAMAFVRLVKLRFYNQLYLMLQNRGPQQGPCGHLSLISVFILMLLVEKIVVLWLQ